jgi:hypothetical protein
VAPVAGGSGDGVGGADVVEEAVYAEGAAVNARGRLRFDTRVNTGLGNY